MSTHPKSETSGTRRGPRLHFDHARAPLCAVDDGPLAGLRHRTVIDAGSGAGGLALWQEEHLPGFVVPPHCHDCEEIITVLVGRIEATVGDETVMVAAGQSILIPEWSAHGFRVIGQGAVRLLAIFGAPAPRIFRPDGSPSTPPWEGGASNHLETPGGVAQEPSDS